MGITKLEAGKQYILNTTVGQSTVFKKGTVVVATTNRDRLESYGSIKGLVRTLDDKSYRGWDNFTANMLDEYQYTSAEDDAGMVLLETGPNAFRKVKRSQMNNVCNQFLRANPYGEVKIWSLNTIARLEMKPIQYISVNDTTALPRPTEAVEEETQDADVVGS